MGRSVKILIEYLRQRQADHGGNAFHFHHVYQNNKIQPSCYPSEAEKVISSGAGKPKAKRPMATEITVDEPTITTGAPAFPNLIKDPNMPEVTKNEEPDEHDPDRQLTVLEDASILTKAEESEVIKSRDGIPAVGNDSSTGSGGITTVGSVPESGKTQPTLASDLSLEVVAESQPDL